MKRWQKIVGIAVAVVVAVLVAGSFVLDSMLTDKAHEQAQQLSQQWQRPVRIGAVSARIFTGLGARVSDVEIGAAKGESAPLVRLERVSVRVGFLRALFSLGKDIDVKSAVVSGLAVSVEKFPDGTTNLTRFQEAMAKQQPKKKSAEPAAPSDLSWLRVDHAALRDGKIALIDKGRTLAIDHLDVTVNDLRAGEPLEVAVKAAVLAEKQNFDLRLKAAPLPKTLMPTPTALALQVDPAIDLAPLGPFAGKSVGLEGGTLQADFDAQLGAMAGGSGPTTIKGGVKLAGLEFAGAQGDKKLDVTLDTDVKADAGKGEVQLDKLRLDIGPAGIVGHGSAHALNSSSPSIEGLEIVSHDLDPSKLEAYYPPLRKQLGGEIAGPIGITIKGSGQSLELRVDLTPVKIALPQQMAKAAGAPMTVVAHLSAASKFDAAIDLAGVDLRPGEALDKKPGQRLDLSLSGTRAKNRIELADLKAHVLDDEAQGSGFYESQGAARKFDVQLRSSHLDLDKLLMTGGKKKESKPLDPQMFAGLDGHARAQIDKLTYKKQTLTDIVVDATIKDDDVKLTTASLKAFGGAAVASGTELKLAHPQAPFHVVAKLDNVALENLIALGSEHKILGGRFNGSVDLSGAGEIARTLSGNVDGHILDGVFYGKDLIAGVSGPLAKSLPFGLAGKEGQGGSTSLGKDLPFAATVENGMARLKSPIKISTPQGELSFAGGASVDGELAMAGTVALAPATIAAITGGKVTPAQPIPVNAKLTGPAWSPSFTDLDLKPAAGQIMKEGGAALAGRALQQAAGRAAPKKIQDEARNRLKGLFGK